MSTGKVPCTVCGVEIQTWTAERTGGMCMPCSYGGRPVPEDFRQVRRRWARKVAARRKGRRTHFAERYEAGDREAVWDELHRLDLRRSTSEEVFADVVACVRLTMRRVRANVEDVVKALNGLGYEFCDPEAAHIAPAQADLATLAAFEDRFGPLPLTLRLFYEEVGSVDLRQSPGQIVHAHDHRHASTSPLQHLGEHDPLYVTPVAQLAEDAGRELPGLSRRLGDPPGSARLLCWLAPDECHKAHCSGGEDYQVYLPEPAVDFPLVGASPEGNDPALDDEDRYPCREGFGPSEFFLTHLRRGFANAGFRGQSDPSGEGPRRAPKWEPLRQVAAGLRPL